MLFLLYLKMLIVEGKSEAMKKIGIFILVMVIFVMIMTGCGGSGKEGEAPKELLDISGNYTGTMIMSKVEIVYDTDEDSNGEEIRNYYEPEGESEWLGQSVSANFRVVVNDDQSVTLAGVSDDGSENPGVKGAYNQDKSEFYYVTEEIGGKNEIFLTFAEENGTITAKGTMLFTHTETGLVNETTIDLKKI